MMKKAVSYLMPVLLGTCYLFAAGSMLCFLIARLTLNNGIFWLGNDLVPFWLCNPAPLIARFLCKRRRFLPLAVYLLCAIALVALTGGV